MNLDATKMNFRFDFSCYLYFHGWVGGWVVGRLESNAKLNSKLRHKLKLKFELSLAKFVLYITINGSIMVPRVR